MTGVASVSGIWVDALAAQGSQQVTQWPQRLLLVLLLLAAVLLVCFGMWRGWRRRGSRQADLVELPVTPADLGAERATCEGRYVGTVRAGDWLDRIVARGLGSPGRTGVSVHAAGVLFERTGAAELFIPAAAITGVGRGRGVAGEVVERDGLTVIGWRLGDEALDTAFRADRAADEVAVAAAISDLIGERAGEHA